MLGTKVDTDLSVPINMRHQIKPAGRVLKVPAIALMLFMSAVVPLEGVEALSREQTDWYSRGIVRQQTINGMTARPKKQQQPKRKKRKAHRTSHRHKR